MKRSLVSGLLIAACAALPPVAGQPPKASPQAPARHHHTRGARPSPRHKLVTTPRHVAQPGVPDSFTVIPKQLSIWGNNVDGDCVSAEEAFAKAAYSLMTGGTEVFISEQALIQWAGNHGYLNGAQLTSVMDSMARDGLTASDGRTYTDGPYQSVDWTNDTILSSAIFAGPVKIGVSSSQLEAAVNSTNDTNGWVATGFAAERDENHCVSLCGFGTMQVLCSALGVKVPAGVNPTSRGYLLFTWGTIGVIDRASMQAITEEAWLRNPTTPQTPAPAPGPIPPNPAPNPAPTPPNPAPTPPGWSGTIVYSAGLMLDGDGKPITGTFTYRDGLLMPAGPPPAPTIGPSQVLIDVKARTVQFGTDFGSRPSGGPTVVVHPAIDRVDVPPGYSVKKP